MAIDELMKMLYNIYNKVYDRNRGESRLRYGLGLCLMLLCFVIPQSVFAQDTLTVRQSRAELRREARPATFLDSLSNDSVKRLRELEAAFDSLAQLSKEKSVNQVDSLIGKSLETDVDSLKSSIIELNLPSEKELQEALEKQFFVPNPKTAMWLAIAFPGGGQIYNRKYWKLPIIYGGFIGCVYALNWNNMMYGDYCQAYIDIMDDDPNTKSYENFIPRGYDVNRNLERIQNLFKKKKNYYRRYRDLSIFCMIGVYALSIVDAYVDAELSSFDISKDLSMKVRPSVIRDKNALASRSPLTTQSYGLQCSFSF